MSEEKTDYNQIAAEYVESKKQPWRSMVEEYSFLSLIGDVTGKPVLDLACGSGHFTRKLKQRGAGDLLGVDISEEMIRLAREEEAAAPLGIRYEVADVCAPGSGEVFGLVVSAWLLVYARSLVELDEFCAGVSRRVAPGGRFVTFTTDPDVYFYADRDYSKYGFNIELEDEPSEGALIRWSMTTGSVKCVVDNYYLPKESYREALLKAGFSEVRYHGLQLSPTAADEAGYWDQFIQNPPAFMIEAIKA
ncbi:class I SAM-dependent methyltransferase [Cerasicoccus frondis]|uniref:class I SAM-dependent methyltransferase n=1 Tax=Cerasicoccus frondis TaxID=490090 RepID=UPI002852C02F|nr:class I SAM-dependent methyltransferase [Cerasicoccus frondis]